MCKSLSHVRLCDPIRYSPPGSSVHGILQARILEWKKKNTGVGCHSLLQGLFLTQGSNPGLLHCKQILYCLSHQGSPPYLREIKHKTARKQSIISLTMTAQYLNKMLQKFHHRCPIIKYFLLNISVQVSPLTDKFGIGNRGFLLNVYQRGWMLPN